MFTSLYHDDQIVSINLYPLFSCCPWLYFWGSCTVLFSRLLYTHVRKAGVCYHCFCAVYNVCKWSDVLCPKVTTACWRITSSHYHHYTELSEGIKLVNDDVSPVNSPHKGQWLGALIFALICARINAWENNREAGDLRRYRAHYDVTVMIPMSFVFIINWLLDLRLSLTHKELNHVINHIWCNAK